MTKEQQFGAAFVEVEVAGVGELAGWHVEVGRDVVLEVPSQPVALAGVLSDEFVVGLGRGLLLVGMPHTGC